MKTRFRFSGHESFPCRYPWLPKGYREIVANPTLFSDEDNAMVKLGVGKNMVRSIRFWLQAFGIAENVGRTQEMKPTLFGQVLLSKNGLDPFLETNKTLWLLHWKISSITDEPLFAWHFLLNQWSEPTFSKTEIVREFTLESDRMERLLSDFTKEQHFDIFLHSYLAGRGKRQNDVLEDTLDCPLAELSFITNAGERMLGESAKKEPIYEFNQEAKPDITEAMFIYCLYDFWQHHRQQENTLSFREISSIHGSVGQIFKLTEPDIRNRLESLSAESRKYFNYTASASVPRVTRATLIAPEHEKELLKNIFEVPKKSAKGKSARQLYEA
jgi:hypothetical protein